jgi:hypothetical protein
MKIPYILMLARVVVNFQLDAAEERTLKDDFILIGKLLLVTVPVLFLLMLQRDLGTALVFMAILAGVILISGVSWRIITPVVGIVVVLFALFMTLFLIDGGKEFLYNTLGMDTYQINRISAWLDPFAYSETDSDFDDKPYVLKAPADESPIDIQRIIDFYRALKMSPREIRYSIKNLSWEKQMEHVINNIFNK